MANLYPDDWLISILTTLQKDASSAKQHLDNAEIEGTLESIGLSRCLTVQSKLLLRQLFDQIQKTTEEVLLSHAARGSDDNNYVPLMVTTEPSIRERHTVHLEGFTASLVTQINDPSPRQNSFSHNTTKNQADIFFELYSEKVNLSSTKQNDACGYRCTFLGCKTKKVFKYRSKLLDHHAVHDNSRKYECSNKSCSATFPRSRSLVKHRKEKRCSSLKNRPQVDQGEPAGPHIEFPNQSSLNTHQSSGSQPLASGSNILITSLHQTALQDTYNPSDIQNSTQSSDFFNFSHYLDLSDSSY